MIANNAQWFAVHASTMAMYPTGMASNANRVPLVDLTPTPSYEKTIEACGGYGERVDNPADLPKAMERAMDKVAGGTQALLNVITMPGGRV
jgi:acetolactate synthase-1/2/3 large subunit